MVNLSLYSGWMERHCLQLSLQPTKLGQQPENENLLWKLEKQFVIRKVDMILLILAIIAISRGVVGFLFIFEGKVVGAIAVSGVSAELEDIEVAKIGLEAILK